MIIEKRYFAPVVPLEIARYLKESEALGSYHLLLAHDVLENPTEYAEVYSDLGPDTDIIMDNSLIELGYPMPIEGVLEAARIVGAKRMVLPDVLGDLQSTIRMVYEACEICSRIDPSKLAGTQPVAVVQGKDIDECIECLKAYRGAGIQSISIPRVLTKLLGSRRIVILAAMVNFGFDDIHLLGFSDNLLDDISCCRLPGVKGIDSAVPIRAGIRNMKISLDDKNFSAKVGPRENYWDTAMTDLHHIQKDLIVHNTEAIREWINR